jgi:regulator of protease activity HflC (stomatin/prohibitin superfamily)
MNVHPRSMDGATPPPTKRDRWRRFVEHQLPIVVIYLMVATLVAIVLAPNVVVTVPSGHVGLMWKRFRGGTVLDPRLLKDEGLRILLPWDRLFLYDLRMQSTTDTYNAITKDGVNLAATINIRFRLKHDAVPQLHQGIGPDYVALLVRPEIGSRMREVIAEYTAEEVYSTKRQEIQSRILGRTEAMLRTKKMERTAEQSEYGEHYDIPLDAMVNLYDTLVLGMELPPAVVAAINRKVEQYYLVQEYAFRVERERKESERKKIEAEGISEFQRIVSQGISDSYVRWRGIEATLQLAQSNNSKVVIIGSGRDGLPIILGNVDAPVSPSGTTPPAENGAPSKQSTTAPTPGSPLERTPASNLNTPNEKTPASAPAAPATNAPAGAPGQKADAAPAEQRSFWPFGLSDLEALLSRATRTAEPQSKQPFDKPPAVQGR